MTNNTPHTIPAIEPVPTYKVDFPSDTVLVPKTHYDEQVLARLQTLFDPSDEETNP